jgi:prepilin-type N-terminal cleavage/methylation domain-containing protein
MQYKLQTGFTMIELMIVVTIATVLAATAMPSFLGLINSTRQTSSMTLLTNDLNRARGEAINRNQRVLICQRATDTACGGGNDWQNGWLVCYDTNQDGACDTATATNPNPIAVRSALSSNLTLNLLGSNASVRFNPNGTQGTGNAVTLTLDGTWTGHTAVIANIAGTGNITKTP